MCLLGKAFGFVVKSLLGVPPFPIRVREFKHWLHFQVQLPDSAFSGRQLVMVQVLDPRPPMREIWIEFLAFSFAQASQRLSITYVT